MLVVDAMLGLGDTEGRPLGDVGPPQVGESSHDGVPVDAVVPVEVVVVEAVVGVGVEVGQRDPTAGPDAGGQVPQQRRRVGDVVQRHRRIGQVDRVGERLDRQVVLDHHVPVGRRGRALAGHGQHPAGDVGEGDVVDAVAELPRELAGTAAELEGAPGGVEGDGLGDRVGDAGRPLDLVRGVPRPGGGIEVGGHAAILPPPGRAGCRSWGRSGPVGRTVLDLDTEGLRATVDDLDVLVVGGLLLDGAVLGLVEVHDGFVHGVDAVARRVDVVQAVVAGIQGRIGHAFLLGQPDLGVRLVQPWDRVAACQGVVETRTPTSRTRWGRRIPHPGGRWCNVHRRGRARQGRSRAGCSAAW